MSLDWQRARSVAPHVSKQDVVDSMIVLGSDGILPGPLALFDLSRGWNFSFGFPTPAGPLGRPHAGRDHARSCAPQVRRFRSLKTWRSYPSLTGLPSRLPGSGRWRRVRSSELANSVPSLPSRTNPRAEARREKSKQDLLSSALGDDPQV